MYKTLLDNIDEIVAIWASLESSIGNCDMRRTHHHETNRNICRKLTIIW